MVQFVHNRQAENAADGLDNAQNPRILVQRQVRARLVVVFHVQQQHVTKALFAKEDDRVNSLTSDRAVAFVCALTLVKSAHMA